MNLYGVLDLFKFAEYAERASIVDSWNVLGTIFHLLFSMGNILKINTVTFACKVSMVLFGSVDLQVRIFSLSECASSGARFAVVA